MKTRADTKEISRIYFWVSSNISVTTERLRGDVSKGYLFEGICEFEAKIEKQKENSIGKISKKKNNNNLAQTSDFQQIIVVHENYLVRKMGILLMNLRGFDLRYKLIPKHITCSEEKLHIYTWSIWEKMSNRIYLQLSQRTSKKKAKL